MALANALDSSTRVTYNSHLQSYLNFCKIHEFPTDPTADTLSFYIVYMARHINPRSLPGYLSGIISRLEHIFPAVRTNANTPLVRRTLQGCKRLNPQAIKRKRPLDYGDLSRLINSLRADADFDDILFVAVVLTGFYALMRLGELVVPDQLAKRNFNKIIRRGSLKITETDSSCHSCHPASCHTEGAEAARPGLFSPTGSEAGDGDESDGADLNGGKRRARTQGGTGDAASAISATPTVRRNFIVVAPGEKLPSTTKKKHPLAIKQASASSPSTPLTSVLPVPNQADEREDNPAPFDSMDTPLSSVSTVNPNDLFQDSRPYKDNTNTTDHTMASLSQAAGPATSSVNQPTRGPTSPPVTRDDLALDVGRMTQFLTPVFDDPLSSGGGLRDKSTALDNLGEFRSDESFHGPADGLSQHSHWLSFGEPNPLMETGDPLLFTDPMSSEGLLSTSLDQELPGDGSSHSYEADPALTLPSSDPSVMDASQALDVSTFLHPWV
ncbi:hypothetical protein M408DRAFT_28981 [Serendipita vermifera MAFF 305830]|uniref:Core-binding (CB) domain-containing protein n=1 Tax=Serendipita vermifera MAFF 305830 TaxID=933852 RepID=A0A0C2WXS6_SERVB|nr:hypothetical protein M408DRAFT_28981 [Serendipita vermifera MAFF 305830]